MTVEAMRRCVEAGGTLDDADALALFDAVEALARIGRSARWYADNDARDPQEVDHALCVEIVAECETFLAPFLADFNGDRRL